MWSIIFVYSFEDSNDSSYLYYKTESYFVKTLMLFDKLQDIVRAYSNSLISMSVTRVEED